MSISVTIINKEMFVIPKFPDLQYMMAYMYMHIIMLTTNEAVILQLFLFSVLLCSEVGKGVNDHTKDEVLKDDDNHYQEEGEIVDES